MSDIYREIEREWVAHYQKMPCETPSRAEFSDACAKAETENRGLTSDGLQPWLGIFEFGIEWLTYIHVALDTQLSALDTENTVDQWRPCHRVTWALIGSAVSFGLSLRTLCLSGFDTPARALVRSFVEILLLCLAVLHDESLARAYQNAIDDKQAKDFWDKRVSLSKVHKLISQIERKLGLDQSHIAEMEEYRDEIKNDFSQSIHLSYATACYTAIAPVLGTVDPLRPAIFGLATNLTVKTICDAVFTIWYFSRLGYNSILGRDPSKCLLAFDKESDLQLKIAVGREVLSSITLRHWK